MSMMTADLFSWYDVPGTLLSTVQISTLTTTLGARCVVTPILQIRKLEAQRNSVIFPRVTVH